MSTLDSACVSCSGPVQDLTGIAQLKQIERMISDNYTIIFISIIIFFILILILWYFSSQLKETLLTYRQAYSRLNDTLNTTGNLGSDAIKNDDSEVYDDENEFIDTTKFFDEGKLDFVSKMKLAYKDYNTKKADYIKNTYSTLDDDVIDTTAMYSKHDDYEYIKKND